MSDSGEPVGPEIPPDPFFRSDAKGDREPATVAPKRVAEPPDARRDDRRRWPLGVTAALLVVIGSGVGYRALRREAAPPSPGRPHRVDGPGLHMPPAAGVHSPQTRGDSPMPGLPPELRGEPEPTPPANTLEDLLALFEGETPDPGGQAFAQDLAKQPELKGAIEKLRLTGSLSAFVKALQGSSAFQTILSEHARRPEFAAFGTTLANHPALKELMDRVKRAGGGARNTSRAGGAALAGGAGPLGFGAGAAGAPSRTPGAGPQFPQAFSAGKNPSPASIADRETASAKGSDGSDTTPLATLKDPVSAKMQRLLERYPWLAFLGDDYLRQLIQSDAIERFGLWGACWSLKIYASCRNACAASGGTCQPLDGWKACKDTGLTELACVGACIDQQPCTVPASTFSQFCVVGCGLSPPAECRGTGTVSCATTTTGGASVPTTGGSGGPTCVGGLPPVCGDPQCPGNGLCTKYCGPPINRSVVYCCVHPSCSGGTTGN